MFFSWENVNFRYTGRWGKEYQCICTTATGSKLELAFKGKELVLLFRTEDNFEPYPHLYISIDGGARIESCLQKSIFINARDDGEHTAEIIMKSAMEAQHRWHSPLVGKVAFLGVMAEELLPLPENSKKTIEFVGDSITEGVLIDTDLTPGDYSQRQRPFHDDVTATYAYLTAEALGLEPYFMGYGAVGVTKGGQGGMPKCADAYPYCFENVPKNYSNCYYILINHGANDAGMPCERYISEYGKLLDLIIELNPKSKIIALSAFCGAHHEALGAFIEEYNKKNGTEIFFIDSSGWVPLEPLHPMRDGHKTIAQHLVPILKEIL